VKSRFRSSGVRVKSRGVRVKSIGVGAVRFI
jgi:hypothetical protein